MTEEEEKREKELRRQDRAQAREMELRKIRELSGKERIRYFWDYYKFVLVIILVVSFTAYIIVNMINGARTETILYTCILNVDALESEDEMLHDDFVQSLGGIGKRQEIVFDTSINIDPEASGTSRADVANTMKMTALLQGGMLDACIAPAHVMEFLQQQGMLLELDDLLERDQKAELTAGGYLYQALPPLFDEETGALLLPEEIESEQGGGTLQAANPDREPCIYAVRIDQTGVLDRYGLFGDEEIWFGIIGSSDHTDMCLELLRFLSEQAG